MTTTTLSSRELNQDVSRAKTAARSGPVFITDGGKPTYALAVPNVADSEFEPPRALIGARPVDLS